MPNAKTRAAADKRRKSRGITAACLSIKARTSTPPIVKRRKDKSTLAKYDSFRTVFDEYIQDVHSGAYQDGEVTVDSWEAWVDARLPFPSPNMVEGVLQFYIDGAKPQLGERIQALTLHRVATVFMAAWRYDTMELIKGEQRDDVFRIVDHLRKKCNLPSRPKTRAELDATSLLALAHGAMDPAFKCFPRHRLSILVYLAITSQTATRPMASLRYRKARGPAPGGARYKDFRLFVMRDDNPSGLSLGGFFKVEKDKTAHGDQQIYPLPAAPELKFSTPHLILFSCVVDGYLTVDEVNQYFDISFLCGEAAREIILPDESLTAYVLASHKGAGLTTQVMTESLEALSVHLGFRQMVQSYCPRHMVAKLLRAARVDIERIKDIMAHDVRGSGIGYYMGRSILMNAASVMRDGKLQQSAERLTASRINTRPHAAAPKTLTEEETRFINEQTGIVELKQKLQEATAAWQKDKSSTQLSLKKRAWHALDYAIKRDTRNTLERNRVEFFRKLDHGELSAEELASQGKEVRAKEQTLVDYLSVPPIEIIMAFKKSLDEFTIRNKRPESIDSVGFRIMRHGDIKEDSKDSSDDESNDESEDADGVDEGTDSKSDERDADTADDDDESDYDPDEAEALACAEEISITADAAQ